MKTKRGVAVSERNFVLKGMSVSVLVGTVLMSVLLFLFALWYANYDLPLELFNPFSAIILLFGCFSSGFVCSRIMNQQGMRWGGICGGSLFLCLLLAALISQNQPLGSAVFTKCAMMVSSGMIGGIMGVNFNR